MLSVEIAQAPQRRFGKRRHAAGLNFGDCFACAVAKQSPAAVSVLRRILAANCPRVQADPMHDVCGMHFPQLVESFG